jgi:hypothetical protein
MTSKSPHDENFGCTLLSFRYHIFNQGMHILYCIVDSFLADMLNFPSANRI